MHDPCASSTLSVLVAEDLDDDYDTVVEAARKAGVEDQLVRVRTLSEVRSLLASAPRPRFGFVLLDVNLPDGGGLDLVRAVRADAQLGTMPVVVFSTSDNPRDLHGLYAAGANAYHVKSLRHRDNLDTLVRIFGYWLDAVCLDDPAG